MSDAVLRENLIRLAHTEASLRKHLVPILRRTAMGEGRITFTQNGVVETFGPGLYDRHLIGYRNSKTVQTLASAALSQLSHQGGLTWSEVLDFVNAYVTKNSRGRFTYVQWDSKSYPD